MYTYYMKKWIYNHWKTLIMPTSQRTDVITLLCIIFIYVYVCPYKLTDGYHLLFTYSPVILQSLA